MLTVVLTPSGLSPANHKLVTIAATVTVADLCDSSPTVVLQSITSSEADNGLGDGAGRTYTVTYRAVDDSGNVTTVSATVFVPKGKG